MTISMKITVTGMPAGKKLVLKTQPRGADGTVGGAPRQEIEKVGDSLTVSIWSTNQLLLVEEDVPSVV